MAEIETNVKAYGEQGFTVFRNALDDNLVSETRDHIDWLIQRHPYKRPEQLTHDLITHDAFWVRLVSEERLLEIASAFLGPNIALFASHYICKPPGNGQAVLWHQDGGYWPLEPMEVITLWLAVDRSDQENGCMKVIPGTQRTDLKAVKERSDVDNVLGSGIDDGFVDENRAVDVVLDPGDVSVHHPNIIHASNANASNRWRRGLTIRYIPATTKIVNESPNPDIDASGKLTEDGLPFPSAFFLRGATPDRRNFYNPWPLYTAETSMRFADVEAWNDRASAWNGKHSQLHRAAAPSE